MAKYNQYCARAVKNDNYMHVWKISKNYFKISYIFVVLLIGKFHKPFEIFKIFPN